MNLKIKNIVLFLSLIMASPLDINGFFSKEDSKLVIPLKLTNNTLSSQSISLFSNSNNFDSGQTQNSIVDTITVGNGPFGIAYDSVNDRMYVANSVDDNVSVIRCSDNVIIATVTVGNLPNVIAYDSFNGRMYVTNGLGDNVSVIRCSDNTVIATITVGNSPLGIAFDSANNRMYVANQIDDNVSVISTATNTVIATITTGNGPRLIAYDSANDRMYVTVQTDTDVDVIDCATNLIIASIPVNSAPAGIAYDSANQRMYVANGGSDNVSVISTLTNAVIATITVGDSPYGVAYDSTNGRMYVTNSLADNVSVIRCSDNTVIATTAVGDFPRGISYNSSSGIMYVTNTTGDSVSTMFTADNVSPTTGSSISYASIVNDLLGNPIAVQNISVYSFAGTINQVSQAITLNTTDLNGNTLTDVLLPVVNPDQIQGGAIPNIETPGFIANGLNYIGLTLLAGETIGLEVAYRQLTEQEIINNRVDPQPETHMPDGKNLIYDGIEKECVKKPFFLTVEEIINCKC